MAQQFPSSPLLSGPFEPIRFECDYDDLIVEGTLPSDLRGVLYRIGPNPQFAPLGFYNPLQGDGMVHAFRIANGRAAYSNRWVRSRRWALEREAGRALFSTSDPSRHDASVSPADNDGAANTHVVPYAGRLLALEEGHAPIALDPATLATVGRYDFEGQLTGNMTAHPKRDPKSGELLFFANFPDRSFDGRLMVYWATPDGRITASRQIKGPFPALVHDFAITSTRILFVLCPLTLSIERLRAGKPPIAWEPDRGTYVGILSRDPSDTNDVRWVKAPTGMMWHTVNAFDDGHVAQLDLCVQAAPAFPDSNGRPAPLAALRQLLTRWTIDPDRSEIAASRQLLEQAAEYPRIDERRMGLEHRFTYLATDGGPGTEDLCHRGIGCFDHRTGNFARWHAPAGHSVSEPVFAASAPGAAEGEGWILSTVFDEPRNRSYLVVLNASDLEAGPVARCMLDHRIPAGFHGSFLPA